MPLLVLMSMVFSSYGWSIDQVVLLLPIIWCAVGLLNKGTRQARCIAALFFLVVNGIFISLRLQQATEFLYLWLAPAMLLGYLVVRRQLAVSERLS